jgi:class 3 adenylate cyclase
MRSQIMVIGRDVALRARLARLLSRGGYRAEIAESVAHARRRGLKGIALGIVAADGLDATAAIELRAALSEVLLVAETDGRAARDADLIDISDETRLFARIAEALASAAEPEATESVLEFAGFRLDLAGHSLRDPKANQVPLTRGEFALLRALAERPGRVLSRNRLMELTAGPVADAFDRSVDMQILRLRRKIEADPKRPSLIVTVPGSGYKFVATAREATPVAPPTSERLAEAAPRTAERHHVTALAAELVSPDGGGLPSDPEELRTVIDEFRSSAAEALAHYGGAIGVARGREIVAYFGDRQAQENDAERAARAALSIQHALAKINAKNASKGAPQLSVRVALESGPVVVDSSGEVFGEVPNVAAQVLAFAEPGSVLVTANVQRQVAGLFVAEEQAARSLKGLSQSVMLYRIVRASGGGRRSRTRALSTLIGRVEELDLLTRRWERARSGQGQFVQLVGEPGIGKSRLVEEFHARLSELNSRPRNCCKTRRCIRSPNGDAFVLVTQIHPTPNASPISRTPCS